MKLLNRLWRSRCGSHLHPAIIESLEKRVMLNATVTAQIAPLSVVSSAAPTTLNLNTYFNDPEITGTVVVIETPQGGIPIALANAQTPQTVANFLSYVESGAFSDAIIHRDVPGFVLQGGGFAPDGSAIASTGSLNAEPGISNTIGTISMALSSGPNSATNQWFINLGNNNAAGGGVNLDDSSDGGPFTAFGHVIYNGMSVADAISALEVVDDSAQDGNFSALPVEADPGSTTPASVPAGDMVTTDTIIASPLSYSVMSSDTSLVVPSVNGGTLTMSYGLGTGIAQITVVATDLGGNTATSVFNVDVGGMTVTVGKGAARSVRFTDPNGVPTTISLGGPGAAAVSFTGASFTETNARGIVTVSGAMTSVSVTATGTTAGSVLSINGTGATPVTMGDILINGSIGTVSARKVVLSGDLTITGTAGSIVLDAANSGNITIGGGSTAVQIVGASTDSLSTGGAIRALTATSWASGNISAGTIISAMNIHGALGANVTVPRIGNAHAGSIIAGNWIVNGFASAVRASSISNWNASIGGLAALAATGDIVNSTLQTHASINTVSAHGMANSNIYVGMSALTLNTVPTVSERTFASVINTVSIGADGFTASNIAAASELKNINITGLVTDFNSGSAFGFAATEVLNLTANASGTKKLHVKAATSQGQVTAAEVAAGVNPQDFNVAIL